jgi:hypothetical protein
MRPVASAVDQGRLWGQLGFVNQRGHSKCRELERPRIGGVIKGSSLEGTADGSFATHDVCQLSEGNEHATLQAHAIGINPSNARAFDARQRANLHTDAHLDLEHSKWSACSARHPRRNATCVDWHSLALQAR